MNMFLSQKVGQ